MYTCALLRTSQTRTKLRSLRLSRHAGLSLLSVQAFKARTKQRAIKRWRRSKRYNKMRSIDDSLPSNRFLELVHRLPRNQSTLLIWLRTGHAPLNHHLHRIRAIESPECDACKTETVETVRHYLLECPAHERARRKTLQKKLGIRKAGSISYLLSNRKATEALMAYADETGRFIESLGTLVEPPLVWPPTDAGAPVAA
jgi:hypothetical protein